MSGRVLVFVVAALSLRAHGFDAGLDGGRADAGARVDAGRASTGAGVDGGMASRAATWRWAEGQLFDGGVSDEVGLFVGAAVEVRFPRRVVYTQCDDATLFALEPLVDSYRFTGVKPGLTHCGFWFDRQPFPNRYVEVDVRP